LKKILFGILGLVMTAGVVGGAAFALFSSSATVTNLSIAAGNASLKVGDSEVTTDTTWDAGLNLTGMYPGYGVSPSVYSDFYVENDSTAEIALNVTATMLANPAGWSNDLKHAVQLGVENVDNSGWSGWYSLPEWRNGSIAFPGGPIPYGTTWNYRVYVRIPYTYGADDAGYTPGPAVGTDVGNEIAGDSLSGAVFTLTGTQAL